MNYGDQTRMPFGKHKGRLLADIPLAYLHWCLGHCGGLWPNLRLAIEEEVERRQSKPALPASPTWPASRSGPLPETPAAAWAGIDNTRRRMLASLFRIRSDALIDPRSGDYLLGLFQELERNLDAFYSLTARPHRRRFDYESLLADAAEPGRIAAQIPGGAA